MSNHSSERTSSPALSPVTKSSTSIVMVPLLRLQKVPPSSQRLLTPSSPSRGVRVQMSKQYSSTSSSQGQTASDLTTAPPSRLSMSPEQKFHRVASTTVGHLFPQTSREFASPGRFRTQKTQNQLKSLLPFSQSLLSDCSFKKSMVDVSPCKQNGDQEEEEVQHSPTLTRHSSHSIQGSTYKLLAHKQSLIKPVAQSVHKRQSQQHSESSTAEHPQLPVMVMAAGEQQQQSSSSPSSSKLGEIDERSPTTATRKSSVKVSLQYHLNSRNKIHKSSSSSLSCYFTTSADQLDQPSAAAAKNVFKALTAKQLISPISASEIDAISPRKSTGTAVAYIDTKQQHHHYQQKHAPTRHRQSSQVRHQSISSTIHTETTQSKTHQSLNGVLPISLPRFLERSYKQNTLILRHGLALSERQEGPRVSAQEYELYHLFQRVISNQANAAKQVIENSSSLFVGMSSLEDRVEARIADIVSLLNELLRIKNTELMTSTVFSKFFESFNYLVFIFYKTEALSLKIHNPMFTSAPFLAFSLTPSELRQRLFHENFSHFFHTTDFRTLVEFVIMFDLSLIQSRAEAYLSRFYSTHLQKLSDNIHETAAKMFTIEQEYLFAKRDPRRIADVFQFETPTFARTQTNTKNTVYNRLVSYQVKHNMTFKKSESQFSLHGQLNNYVTEIRKNVAKYEMVSPFSPNIDPYLKANLVKMYNTLPPDN